MKDYLQMIPPRLLSLFIMNIFRYTITRKNIQSDTVPESMNFAHYQHCGTSVLSSPSQYMYFVLCLLWTVLCVALVTAGIATSPVLASCLNHWLWQGLLWCLIGWNLKLISPGAYDKYTEVPYRVWDSVPKSFL